VTPSELARFKRFCAEILDLRLEPFEVKIANEVFSDRRETLVVLPRGNGKSTALCITSTAIPTGNWISNTVPLCRLPPIRREYTADRDLQTRPPV